MYRNINEEGILQSLLDLASNHGEGYFKSIANRILGRKSFEDTVNIKTNIAKSASALTATFPVIVTEATSLDAAVMISKAIERKAITLLQMLFAANQITNVTSASEYLKNFHQNIDSTIDISDMDVDDVIDYTNKLSENADTDLEFQASINEAIDFVLNNTKYAIQNNIPADLNETYGINEYMCKGSVNKPTVYLNELSNQVKTTNKDQFTVDLGPLKVSKEYKDEMDDNMALKNSYDAINKGVLSSDITKSNESVPSLMVVNFVSLVPGTNHQVTNVAVIGVKAVLHYVPSEEMVNRIIMKNSDNHGLLNFIRATTGEIAFFKDFLFSIDKAKIDAVSRSGKGSNNKIWKILELRADKSKLNRASGHKNDCAAITTIVINKTEVDLIKKYHRIDLTRPGTLLSIMKGYNLLCGVIVDEVIERVDFMYDDGDPNFETLSFMSLEREKSDGQLKKVINVLAANRR